MSPSPSKSTEVGVIRSDGTGQRVLATDLSYVGWIEWSPDGKWLIVSPWSGPVLLFDVQTGLRIPIPTLGNYVATAWRP
jgi:WD40 repeat protein